MEKEKLSHYLDEEQENDLCFKIIRLLNGIPISQARNILRETHSIMLDTHLVDVGNPQYKIKAEEFDIS